MCMGCKGQKVRILSRPEFTWDSRKLPANPFGSMYFVTFSAVRSVHACSTTWATELEVIEGKLNCKTTIAKILQHQPWQCPVPSGHGSRLVRLGWLATGIAGGMLAEGARQLAKGNRPKVNDLLLTPAASEGRLRLWWIGLARTHSRQRHLPGSGQGILATSAVRCHVASPQVRWSLFACHPAKGSREPSGAHDSGLGIPRRHP